MLKVYAVKRGDEYLAFYLKKADANADVKEREGECVVVPIEIRERY